MEVVPRAGIEPAAFPLGGGRSIHWATGAKGRSVPTSPYDEQVQAPFACKIALVKTKFGDNAERRKVDIKRSTGSRYGTGEDLFGLVARVIN